jgi:OOP family OmpA-OmpF porin
MLLLLAAEMAWSQGTLAQERAQRVYEQAMSQPDGPEKEALLKQSVVEWKSFAAYYALGNLQLTFRRFADARDSFQNALALVNDVKPMAACYFKIGLAREGEGEFLEGISWLEFSMVRVNDPVVGQELKRMRLAAAGRTQPVGQIARALMAGKTLGTTPKVDLQVNFEFNRSDLTASGKSQSEELGKLLEQLNEPGYQMIFIGHTDELGADEYNQKLSLDRAEAVKRYIVERYSIASTRIKTEGHGRREPLYNGPTEENNRLNRRVEVKLVPK